MGFFTHEESFASGTGGLSGPTNPQCTPHSAPSEIHCLMSATCSCLSLSFFSGGGMTSSGSLCVIRSMIRDFDGSPGTIALPLSPPFSASFSLSNRSPPSTVSASGPWQA